MYGIQQKPSQTDSSPVQESILNWMPKPQRRAARDDELTPLKRAYAHMFVVINTASERTLDQQIAELRDAVQLYRDAHSAYCDGSEKRRETAQHQLMQWRRYFFTVDLKTVKRIALGYGK